MRFLLVRGWVNMDRNVKVVKKARGAMAEDLKELAKAGVALSCPYCGVQLNWKTLDTAPHTEAETTVAKVVELADLLEKANTLLEALGGILWLSGLRKEARATL